jgi:AraC-like DNA-binding protein
MARIADRDEWARLAEPAGFRYLELAALCDYSPRQLQRHFRRIAGRPPQEWLNELRVFKAQELLLMGKPPKEIAWELGYKQFSHFCRHFKHHTGMTTSEFLALHAKSARSSSRAPTNPHTGLQP